MKLRQTSRWHVDYHEGKQTALFPEQHSFWNKYFHFYKLRNINLRVALVGLGVGLFFSLHGKPGFTPLQSRWLRCNCGPTCQMNSKFNFLPGSLNTSHALHFEAGSVFFSARERERETQKVAFFWCSHSALRCCDQTAVKLYLRMRFNGRYNLLWVAYGWRSTSDKIKQIVSHSKDLLIGLRDTSWHFSQTLSLSCVVNFTHHGLCAHLDKMFHVSCKLSGGGDRLSPWTWITFSLYKHTTRSWIGKGMRQFWKTNGC